MAKGTTPTDMQNMDVSNLQNDYHDANNGILYNLVPSNKFDSFTVTFLKQKTFQEMSELLNKEYTFKCNANGTATTATTLAGNQKVVLSLYKTKKLLIQGNGSWEWRNTVFRDFSSQLTPLIPADTQINPGNTPNRHVSEPMNMEDTASNSRPIHKLYDTLINEIISPKDASTPSNAKIRETRQSSRKKSTDETNRNSSQENASVADSYNEQNNITVELDDENEATSENISSGERSGSSNAVNQISLVKQDLQKQRKENKELQKSARDLLQETQTLKKENNKLRQAIGAKDSELNIAKRKLQNNSKTIQQHEQSIADLKKKLASVSADSLVFGEQKDKLKEEVKILKAEKLKLVDKLMQTTTVSDSLEDKLEREFEILRQELSNEIKEVKEHIRKSAELTKQPTSSTSSAHTTTNVNSGNKNNSNAEPASSSRISETGVKTVFIAGDDTTSVLSTRILSDSNISVKIKSHKDGKLMTLESTLDKLSEDKGNYTKSLSAVVLHAGANNITNAESVESIVHDLKKVTDTIRKLNPKVKILVSSTIPRRNDRLVNSAIASANQSVKNACQEHNLVYIDNDKNFYEDRKPDVSLYKDAVSLNKKGGKFLGQNIKAALQTVLGLQSQGDREPSATVHKQDFRFRPPPRQSDQPRRIDQPRPMIPPWMAFYPPWMPAHPQQHWK